MSERPRGHVMRHCEHCTIEIWRYPCGFNGKRIYCSQRCKALAMTTPIPVKDEPVATADANVPTPRTKAPPWPVVKRPEDEPRERIRARFRAVRERWEATA